MHTAILLAGFEVSLIDDKVPHSVPVAEIPYPTEEQNEQPEREFREELQRLLLPKVHRREKSRNESDQIYNK